MGDVLDATSLFRAREYGYRWDAFCCGQMSVPQLIAEIKADRHFSVFCVERVRELRARQIESAVLNAMDWDDGA